MKALVFHEKSALLKIQPAPHQQTFLTLPRPPVTTTTARGICRHLCHHGGSPESEVSLDLPWSQEVAGKLRFVNNGNQNAFHADESLGDYPDQHHPHCSSTYRRYATTCTEGNCHHPFRCLEFPILVGCRDRLCGYRYTGTVLFADIQMAFVLTVTPQNNTTRAVDPLESTLSHSMVLHKAMGLPV